MQNIKLSLNQYSNRIIHLLNDSTIRASSSSLLPWTSFGRTSSIVSPLHHQYSTKTIETEDIRTVTKIEMLEAQLADLKRLLEAQAQLASLGALQAIAQVQQPPPPSTLPTTMTPHPITNNHVINSSQPNVTVSSVPVTLSNPSSSGRPNMVNVLSGMNTNRLRKTTIENIPSFNHSQASSSSVPNVSDSQNNGGLSNLLKHALDKRFAQIHHHSNNNSSNIRKNQHLASPCSNISSDSGSEFCSPNSQRGITSVHATNTRHVNNAVNIANRRLSRKLSNLVPASIVSPSFSSSIGTHPIPLNFDEQSEPSSSSRQPRTLQRTFSTTAVPLPNAMQQSISSTVSSVSENNSNSTTHLPRALQQLQQPQRIMQQRTQRKSNIHNDEDDNDSVTNWSEDEDSYRTKGKNNHVTIRKMNVIPPPIPIAPVAPITSSTPIIVDTLPVANPAVVTKPPNLLGAIQGFSKANLKKTNEESLEVMIVTNPRGSSRNNNVSMNDFSVREPLKSTVKTNTVEMSGAATKNATVKGNSPINLLDSIKGFNKEGGLKKLTKPNTDENTNTAVTSTMLKKSGGTASSNTTNGGNNTNKGSKTSVPVSSTGGFNIQDLGKVQLRRTGAALK